MRIDGVEVDPFSLPMGASPEGDRVVGMDELGRRVYETRLGERYTINVTRPPQQEFETEAGTFSRAREVAQNYITGVLEGIRQGVTAPRRALEGQPVTLGDATATAGFATTGTIRPQTRPQVRPDISQEPDLWEGVEPLEGEELVFTPDDLEAIDTDFEILLDDEIPPPQGQEPVATPRVTLPRTTPQPRPAGRPSVPRFERRIQPQESDSIESLLVTHPEPFMATLGQIRDIYGVDTSDIPVDDFRDYIDDIPIHEIARQRARGYSVEAAIDAYGTDPTPENVAYVNRILNSLSEDTRDILLTQYPEYLRNNPDFNPFESVYREGPPVTTFQSPILSLIDQIEYPKKGILGSQFLKQIRNNPDVREAELNSLGLEIDPQRRYTQQEISDLVRDNVYTTFVQEHETFRSYQRQRQQGLDLPEEEYFELVINSVPGRDNPGFRANSQHYGNNTLAHTRGSIVRDETGPAILVEEIQSDLLQQGYVLGANDPKFSWKKQFEELETAFEDTIRARQNFASDPNTPDPIVDLVSAWRKLTEQEKKRFLFLASGKNRMEGYRELTSLIQNLLPPTTPDVVDDFSAILINYSKVTDLKTNPPPISRTEDTVRLALDALMARGQTSGVTRIIIPPFDRIVAARFPEGSGSYNNALNPKSGFYATYITSLKKVLNRYSQEFGDAFVIREIELPYENRGGTIDMLPAVEIDFTGLSQQYDLTRPRFAEGGMVEPNMETQMDRLLQEGGIADDGMNIDPISGNEIPPGSMAEEVRDDVDAKLSTGEYVVPADVVRFFGVAFFEKLRKKAKEGLSEMEDDGRIGGEPEMEIPEYEEDDDEMEMAKGGDVGIDKNAKKILESLKRSPQLRARLAKSGVTIKMAEGGVVEAQTQTAFNIPNSGVVGFSTLGGTTPVFGQTQPTQKIEYKTYVNAQGDKRVIMFIDGQPQQPIPAGFYLEGTTPPTQEPSSSGGSNNRRPTVETQTPRPRQPQENLYGMSESQLDEWSQGGLGGSFLGGMGGLIGTAANLDALSRTRAAAMVARDRGLTALQTQLEDRAGRMQQQLGPLGDLLEGAIATGVQRYQDQQMFRNTSLGAGAVRPKTPGSSTATSVRGSGQARGTPLTRTATGSARPTTFTPSGRPTVTGSAQPRVITGSAQPRTTPLTRTSTGSNSGSNFLSRNDDEEKKTTGYTSVGGGVKRAKGGLIQRPNK